MTTRREAMRLLGAATLVGGQMAVTGRAAAAPRATGTAAGGGADWQVVTSAPGADRFAARPLGAFQPAGQPPETDIAVFVDTSKRYQEVFGFGGAVTDAVAEVHATLAPAQQQAFLAAYFDPRAGLGYNILRTTIHSSDFGSGSYTYVRDGDRSLASFSIAPDLKLRVPLLRAALAAGRAHGADMRVFASPWSAPAWMKSNNSMLAGGTLLPAYRDTWARYVVKFIQAYEQAGVPLWGLSVQNEPMAKQKWESMIFSAEEETRFLGDHLGPALKAAGLGGKKVIVWDHNRDLLPQRAATLLADAKARPYIWGVGYHWYETWAGGEPMHRNVAAVHAAWPDVNLLMTEGCIEKFDPARLQDWANGERYGREMIADLNAGSSGPSSVTATSASAPTSTLARPPPRNASCSTPASITRSARCTMARPRWTGWSRSRNAASPSPRRPPPPSGRAWPATSRAPHQHHRHARPRRLHHRGRALDARARRRRHGL
jgi:glucosylceramidase